MISQSDPIRIPPQVETKLLEVRVARDRARLATVAALGLLVLLLMMSLAMLVDWTLTLFDPFWRSVLTGAALTTVALTIIAAGVIAWRSGRRLAVVARDVDHAVPTIEERWWTVAELAAAPLEQQRRIHTGMLNRLSRESASLESHVVPEDVVSLRGVLWAVLGMCTVIIALLVACVLDWRQTGVLAMRFWAPTADISVTRLHAPEGDVVAARGEPVVLEATQTGRLAEEGTLFLKRQEGEVEDAIVLTASGPERDRFVHRLKSLDAPLSYRVRAGDGQTGWVNVLVADRPQLAGVRFLAVPPQYTGRETIDLAEWPAQLNLIEGTELEIALQPRGEVQSITLHINDDIRQQLARSPDNWHRYRTMLTKDLTLSAVLVEPHGLENKRPPICRIKVSRDQPPTVKVANPNSETAARPDDEIEIQFSAGDDFGIAKAELVIYDESAKDGPPQELKVIEIPLGDEAGAESINRSVPLDLSQFKLQDGQSISYAVRVYDTRQAVTASAAEPEMLAQETPPPAPAAGDVAPVDQSPLGDNEPKASDPATKPDSAPASTELATTQSAPASAAPATSPPQSNPTAPNTATQPANSPPLENTSSPPATAPPLATEPAAKSDNALAAANATSPPGAPKNVSPPAADPAAPPSSPAAASATPSSKVQPPPSNERGNGSLQTGAPKPPDNMTRRGLDVAQSSSSSRMRINIDKWAGSYAGRQREKLEMVISPTLDELDQILERAENHLKSLLDELQDDIDWAGPQDRVLGQAEKELSDAIQLVADLNTKAANTPYAFVGLQLSEIADSHIAPAHESVWVGRQAQSNDKRQPPVESAWQQTGRARQRLQQLVSQYERVRREHQLADAIENVKTMYQAFVEDSFALLDQQKSPINNYQRKIAEFELDEEYLKRLEEVLKMRQKLIAEFARILAADPRLLRRFIDSINSESESLRDQLTLLALRQQELDEELRTWVQLPDKVRDRASAAIIQKRLRESISLAEKAAQLHERFQTWSPLDLGIADAEFAEAAKQFSKVALAARKVESHAASWRPPEEQSSGHAGEVGADSKTDEPTSPDLNQIIAASRELYDELRTLDGQLLQLSGQGNRPELATFVVKRLAETRELIGFTSGWIVQLEHLEADNYPAAASVQQHHLAEETNVLAAGLANLEQQLTGVLGSQDGKLPADIAELSRKLLRTLDEDVGGSQLGAVFALQRKTLPAATQRTQDAVEGFARAETLFDELFQRVIEEADKLPVQDPIADLLDDPTLDELLALLESEQDLAAALGIPARPSNLQTIGDWLRRGTGGGGGMNGNSIMAQLARQQPMLNRASQRAVQRTKTQTDQATPRRGARRIDEWNVVASDLENKLLQGRGQLPPERYRRAIEQYFDELSRRVSDDEEHTR